MKRLFFIIVSGVIGFYGLSFAFNEFSYESAKSLASEYIENSSFDENWKDSHPHVEGEGKYFYTDAETPSYVEFKVSCDTTPDCGFVLVNFDGDDVSIPIASTSGNTPSEVLAAKNGNDIKDNKLYYFNPFEQYAENEVTGDIASIDPQDDFGDEVFGSGNITPEVKKSKKAKKNKSLKDKIVKAKSEAKEFKKSDDFKKKRKELKDKKQTIPKEEVSFKYLDMALADNPPIETQTGYITPGNADKFLTGSSTANCGSRIPCYTQYLTNQYIAADNKYADCYSGCSPTALAMIYGYYDRTGVAPNLVAGTAIDYFTQGSPNSTIKGMVESLKTILGTTCKKSGTYYGGVTNPSIVYTGISYAKNKGYSGATSAYTTGNNTTLFSKIKTEINGNRPVLIHITSTQTTEGHAAVAYGYKSTGTLPIVRINMGWGYTLVKGTNNVYYSNMDVNLDGIYYSGTNTHKSYAITTIKIK